MEPELVIFCDQVRLWMVRIGHQPRHKIYQPVLPARSTVVVVAQSLWEWPTNDWSNLRELFLFEIWKKKSSFDIPIYYVTSLKTQNYKGQLDIASYKMMSQSQHSDLSTASLFWEMKYFIIYSNQFNRKYRAVYLMFFFKHIFSIKARMVHDHNIL